MSLFEELQRRNVIRVAVAYVLLGWAVLQGADFLLDLAGAPEWVIRALAVIGLVGLPFALFFAWAFEITPEGIKREHEVDRSGSVTQQTSRKLNGLIIGLLLVIILLMAVERIFFVGGSGPDVGPDSAGVTAPKSIAVLPFTDLSQAQDQGWFADGLAEEILNALVRVPDLAVTARTSSFVYKGSNRPISEIAAELGVAHVLEGSVRSSADRIRVTAQLIRASDGFHLWSQNYDRDVADMIGIQEDLARNIATALETSMDPEALAQMARVGTKSVEAYQEYLRGLQAAAEAFNMHDGRVPTRQAYEHFERARAIDPGFFDAHVQAANYWKIELTPSRTDSGTSGLEPPQMLREYNERIGQAVDHARTEADRLRSLADRALVDLRLREARRLFDQYLELRPNDDLTRFELAGVLGTLSDGEAFREVLAYWKAKGQTDQFAANNYINEAYRWADPAEAADFALEVVQRWPNSSTLLYQAHRTLLWAGRNRQATELAARYAALVPEGNPLVSAREACAAGDRKAAEQILTGLKANSVQDLSTKWILLNMLGDSAAEIEVLRPLEQSGVPFQLASFLGYPKFDARPYPALMAVLEREGVQRPPPPVPPFRCPPPAEPSVAVLPFVNISADPRQEYFSDGITEEIINALVRVPGVKVAARTSVFAFKGREQDIRAIGNELGVTHVVEGSVRSEGAQLRITAQLIQVQDGFHLWSETFDRPRVNVFAIQEEIAAAIAGVLNERLGAKEAVPDILRISVKAYDDYLRGRAHLRARSDEDLAEARRLFESVTAAHADYAPAWAALAITNDVLDEHEPAERFALRALELAPDNVDALTALGAVYRDTQRWEQAAAAFERAMALDPDSAQLAEDFGEFLARTGRMEKLLEVTSRGYGADPFLVPLVEVYAVALIAAGRTDEAIAVLEQAIARGGADWLSQGWAAALVGKGDGPGLRALISRAPIAAENRSMLLDALDHPGDASAAATVRALLPVERGAAPGYGYAQLGLPEIVLLHLGDVDAVIANYRELAASGATLDNDGWFLPVYQGFRAHPGFAGVLEGFGLPAHWDQAGWPEFCKRGADGAITCM
jgi:TolB-like protein/Tfp pilus assembly protein PilF